jgi:hypothetical protein
LAGDVPVRSSGFALIERVSHGGGMPRRLQRHLSRAIHGPDGERNQSAFPWGVEPKEVITMLVTFKTEAYANITMFGDVAVPLIKLMGHSGSVPGALLAEDVPEALERLKSAVAAHPDAPLDPARAAGRNENDEGSHVSLAHRALPLIELLSAAAAQNKNVMWDD